MNKKWLLVIIVIGLTCSFISSCQKQVDNTAADIDALKNSVANLQKRSDSLAAALAATNSNVTNLGKVIDSIKVQLFQITNQITSLNGQLTTVNANITAINSQISDLNKKYLDLLNRLNALILEFTNTTAYLNSRIDSLSFSIKVLQKRSDSLINALAITNNNLLVYSKTVDTIKIQLVFIIGQINQLNIQLTSTNANTSLINAQITLLNQQYLDLLAKLNALLNTINNVPGSLTNGLIAWFPFTGNANDSSGNSNHGIVNGATLTTDRFGNSNSAYSFNNNYILIPSSSNYAVTNFTISFWLSSTSTQTQVPLKKNTYSNSANEQFAFALNDLNPYGVEFTCKYNNPTCTPGVGWNKNEKIKNILDGNYHHLVGVANGNQVQLWIDGVLVNTITGSSSSVSSCFGGDIQVGRDWSSFPNYFKGKIDDIRIYNRALSDVEITYLYSH